jgi:hypothetical protein
MLMPRVSSRKSGLTMDQHLDGLQTGFLFVFDVIAHTPGKLVQFRKSLAARLAAFPPRRLH